MSTGGHLAHIWASGTGGGPGGRPTDKVDQGGAVYPEEKEYHEPGHRDLSTKPHMGQRYFRVTWHVWLYPRLRCEQDVDIEMSYVDFLSVV